MDTDVLICGAGPTGMILALRLVRAGIRVRLIDAAPQAGTTSRAMVVHARTLEFYKQMGIDKEFLEQCLPFSAVNLWVRRRKVARVVFGDAGIGLSPFPYAVVCPQDRHERFLETKLNQAGVMIQRYTKLIAFQQTADDVQSRLELSDGMTTFCRASYLAGCDGAHSQVRHVLGIDFSGGTYSHRFFVADVEATGPMVDNEIHVAIDEANFVGVFPLLGGATARLIGIAIDEFEGDKDTLTWDMVGQAAAESVGVHVSRVNWFSTYRVHHRVADRFHVGRVFLLGDAAHVHSPVGGQGMNTGIGDAVNLSWKLADVIQGRASSLLLDTYELERIEFARQLVRTTDRVFTVATSAGRIARFVRTKIIPITLPNVVRLPMIRRLIFRKVSQTGIRYRHSPLSNGRNGSVHGGDRLPWFGNNFDSLDGLHWQVHVYGEATPDVKALCQSRGIKLMVFEWTPEMKRSGLIQNGRYVIRPDGHVAVADSGTSINLLEQYLLSQML
jgi:2-polyprenyl-6-methoxyphenol hydroxylase-like FAD-dependent oxidoreductase